MIDSLHALYRRLLSYRKATWEIADYPVRVRFQDSATVESRGPRLKPVVWSAQIVNWWQLGGHGDTREDALEDLRRNFESYRDTHATLPRPGTSAPIEFAAAERVNSHPEIAREFLDRILGLHLDECFISDESSLWDFHGDDSNDDLVRKITLLYGIDASELADAKLCEIFERIAASRQDG
jgi:hypothetical protein